MNTVSILIKTDPKLKKAAQKIADEMGISLTSVINRYLKQFVATRSITFTSDDEQPTEYFNHRLAEAEADIKSGNLISFENPAEATAYVKQKISYAKKNKPTSSH